MKQAASLFFIFGLLTYLCACGRNIDLEWQEQYDLGVRCLSEGSCEEAVTAFSAAIEIAETLYA